jgi:hypothetical protein
LLVLALVALGFGAAVAPGDDDDDDDGPKGTLRARLRARNEIPIVVSDARGEFRGKVDLAAQTIQYELSYSGLEGDVTQAHIHAGQVFTNGGIMIWLCANNPPITTAPPGTQVCPVPPATITGTITAAEVVGPTGQAIPAGSFADAIDAIRGGNAYVNVHTTSAPGGELRGQIR